MHEYATCMWKYDIIYKFDSQGLGWGGRKTEFKPSQGYKAKLLKYIDKYMNMRILC